MTQPAPSNISNDHLPIFCTPFKGQRLGWTGVRVVFPEINHPAYKNTPVEPQIIALQQLCVIQRAGHNIREVELVENVLTQEQRDDFKATFERLFPCRLVLNQNFRVFSDGVQSVDNQKELQLFP